MEVNAAVARTELKDSLSWLLQWLWLCCLHLPLLLLLTSFRTHHHWLAERERAREGGREGDSGREKQGGWVERRGCSFLVQSRQELCRGGRLGLLSRPNREAAYNVALSWKGRLALCDLMHVSSCGCVKLSWFYYMFPHFVTWGLCDCIKMKARPLQFPWKKQATMRICPLAHLGQRKEHGRQKMLSSSSTHNRNIAVK